ncbi:MAG: DUF4129 domain-containing transglutaminase family protein [Limisphaerales bacterium]
MNGDLVPARGVPLILPALVLWGWQADLLPWGLGMGLGLEAARFSPRRFDLRQADFARLWNFTTLLFLGVLLYLFLARQGLETMGNLVNTGSPAGQMEGLRRISQAAVTFLRWQPFVLFPFVLVHAWSRSRTLPWSTFSLYQQARMARAPDAMPPEWATRQVHPGHPYLALVLFASCASTLHPVAYLPLLVLVMVAALWPWRNRRYGAPTWVGLLAGLLVLSLVAPEGLSAVRQAWQAFEDRWMQRVIGGNTDQIRSFTALGTVGRLKQSGRIVWRIRTADGDAPGLLREAAFNRFRTRSWSSAHREFQSAGSPDDGGFWRLASGRRGGRLMTLSRHTAQGDAPLALPGDVGNLRELPALAVETNYLAAARLRGGPPLIVFSAEYGEGGGFDGAPEDDDLNLDHLDPIDRGAVVETAARLGLAGQSPLEAIATVERFFSSGFEYSLWQGSDWTSTNRTPLSVFLGETRAGHCEYFATATVLLLRAAGVPTRYAVGFSPEARQGNEWLARGRDAHAWCLAHVNGRWRDIDTTPGIWREREADLAGWWEGITDAMSHAWYRFALWRQAGGNWQFGVFAVAMGVLGWLGWRQLRGSRWRWARGTPGKAGAGQVRQGLDSEFYTVVRRLSQTHGERAPHETLSNWIRRLGPRPGPHDDALREALGLHYRLRFDPAGLAGPDRDRLRKLASDLTRNPVGSDLYY